jgi:hypothetical protein
MSENTTESSLGAPEALPTSWTDQLTALTEAFQQTYQAHVTALQDTITASWAAWHEDVAAIQQMVQQLAAMDAERAATWTSLQERLHHLASLVPDSPAASPTPPVASAPVPVVAAASPPTPAAPPPVTEPAEPPQPDITWASAPSVVPTAPAASIWPSEAAPAAPDTGITWNQSEPDPVLPQLVRGL